MGDPEADEPMEEGEAQDPELLADIRELLATALPKAQAFMEHAEQAQGSEEQVYVVTEVAPGRFRNIPAGEVPEKITRDELQWTIAFLDDAGNCKVYSHIHHCGFRIGSTMSPEREQKLFGFFFCF